MTIVKVNFWSHSNLCYMVFFASCDMDMLYSKLDVFYSQCIVCKLYCTLC